LPERKYSRLGENTSSLGQKISRLGESTPESTLGPGASSLGRLYPRLSELLSRLGENSPESILATRNHSRLGEMMSPGRIMQKNQQNSLYQSYHACLR